MKQSQQAPVGRPMEESQRATVQPAPVPPCFGRPTTESQGAPVPPFGNPTEQWQPAPVPPSLEQPMEEGQQAPVSPSLLLPLGTWMWQGGLLVPPLLCDKCAPFVAHVSLECTNAMCRKHCLESGVAFCERHTGAWQQAQDEQTRKDRAGRRRGGSKRARPY